MVATGFFAAQDMKTPVTLGIISLIINAVLNLIFMSFMKEAGLALATSIASIIEFGMLIYYYQKKISGLPLREILFSYARIMAASLAMGLICFVCYHLAQGYGPGSRFIPRLVRVFGSIGISAAAYVAFCFLFRVSEMKEAVEFFRKKTKRGIAQSA